MVDVRKEILNEVQKRQRNDLFRCEVMVFTKGKSQERTRGCTYDFDEGKVKTEIPEGSDHEKRDTPYLKIGEEYTIRLFSHRSGYVHVFNLGSSGSVEKMFPSGGGLGKSANHIAADIPLIISNYSGNTGWEEMGPESAAAGNPEGILVVLTKDDVTLREHNLHIDLNRYAAKGTRGGLGKESQGISELYSKPEEEIAFGYYAFEVLKK
ncbi:MAG: DUF4384 domain-containing protein [Spirochaetia bacterium]|nr:DUF4384 domain-containing protein [Spirochaetia bacterium]